jgi:hypothetical protein
MGGRRRMFGRMNLKEKDGEKRVERKCLSRSERNGMGGGEGGGSGRSPGLNPEPVWVATLITTNNEY